MVTRAYEVVHVYVFFYVLGHVYININIENC